MLRTTTCWQHLRRHGVTAVLLLLSVRAGPLAAQGNVGSPTAEDSVRALESARDGRWQAVAMQHTMIP